MFVSRLKKTGRYAAVSVFALLLSFLAVVGVFDAMIPQSITLYSDESVHDCGMPAFVTLDYCRDESDFAPCIASGIEANARLFGVLPLKSVRINTVERVRLYPGGMPFGVRFYTDGVPVVGVASVCGESGECTPAHDAGIRVKDIIRTVDGVKVTTVGEVTRLIESSEGRELTVGLRRGNTDITVVLKPIYSAADSLWKAGLWIRDSTAGIGTVTYIDPTTLEFAGLGHGICDVDTGELMPLGHADVCEVALSSVAKGRAGSPGELRGSFMQGSIGALGANTESGVFGQLDVLLSGVYGEPVEIALGREVREGSAALLCTVDGGEVREYSVEIEKLRDTESRTKNFIVRVTDPELLAATGGIVQGMSGSPILQNGKLIGAVTHVLVNDPARGYGIFIENMLEVAG